jgi:hypothetical protein
VEEGEIVDDSPSPPRSLSAASSGNSTKGAHIRHMGERDQHRLRQLRQGKRVKRANDDGDEQPIFFSPKEVAFEALEDEYIGSQASQLVIEPRRRSDFNESRLQRETHAAFMQTMYQYLKEMWRHNTELDDNDGTYWKLATRGQWQWPEDVDGSSSKVRGDRHKQMRASNVNFGLPQRPDEYRNKAAADTGKTRWQTVAELYFAHLIQLYPAAFDPRNADHRKLLSNWKARYKDSESSQRIIDFYWETLRDAKAREENARNSRSRKRRSASSSSSLSPSSSPTTTTRDSRHRSASKRAAENIANEKRGGHRRHAKRPKHVDHVPPRQPEFVRPLHVDALGLPFVQQQPMQQQHPIQAQRVWQQQQPMQQQPVQQPPVQQQQQPMQQQQQPSAPQPQRRGRDYEYRHIVSSGGQVSSHSAYSGYDRFQERGPRHYRAGHHHQYHQQHSRGGRHVWRGSHRDQCRKHSDY